MKHLDPKRLRSVAKRLKASDDADDRTLDFSAIGISGISKPFPPCGTVACLAGHWLHIRASDVDVKPSLELLYGTSDLALWDEWEDGSPWRWGANLLTVDLGLGDMFDMLLLPEEERSLEDAQEWGEETFRPDLRHLLSGYAARHPRIWGNPHGEILWKHGMAWEEHSSHVDPTLSTVADHMLRVAERIPPKGEPA